MEVTVVPMIVTPGGQPGTDAGLAVVPQNVSADANRFSSLMAPDDPVPGVAPTTVAPVSAPSDASIGDAILDRLHSVGAAYRTKRDEVTGALESDSLGVRQLLKLQIDVAEMSLHVDVFSKGVAKLLSHVDQLTKLQ